MDIINFAKNRKSNKGFFFKANDVDYAIFSQISYLNFHLIYKNKPILLKNITENEINLISKDIRDETKSKELLKNIQKNKNYRKFKIIRIENITNYEIESQFYAIAIKTSFKNIAVIFRGTDGTIVGWKENFNMGYLKEIPAQIKAKEFLNQIITTNKHKTITVVGHSKGGNLAEYSALSINKFSNHIDKVINFDGPGFKDTTIYNNLEIKNKIIKYVPIECLVGSLFNSLDLKIVKSNGGKLEQHSLFNWEIDETTNSFIFADRSRFSKIFEKTFITWFNNFSLENVEEIINEAIKIFNIDIKEKISNIDFSKSKFLLSLLKPANSYIRKAFFDLLNKFYINKKDYEK